MVIKNRTNITKMILLVLFSCSLHNPSQALSQDEIAKIKIDADIITKLRKEKADAIAAGLIAPNPYDFSAFHEAQILMARVYYCLQYSAEDNAANVQRHSDKDMNHKAGFYPKEFDNLPPITDNLSDIDSKLVEHHLHSIINKKHETIEELIEQGFSQPLATEAVETALIQLSKEMAKGHYIASASYINNRHMYAAMINKHYPALCNKGRFSNEDNCRLAHHELMEDIAKLHDIYNKL